MGRVLGIFQDFILPLPENQNQSPRQSVFIDPLVLSHIETKGLGNKAGSLTVDGGPPQELYPPHPHKILFLVKNIW